MGRCIYIIYIYHHLSIHMSFYMLISYIILHEHVSLPMILDHYASSYIIILSIILYIYISIPTTVRAPYANDCTYLASFQCGIAKTGVTLYITRHLESQLHQS